MSKNIQRCLYVKIIINKPVPQNSVTRNHPEVLMNTLIASQMVWCNFHDFIKDERPTLFERNQLQVAGQK